MVKAMLKVMVRVMVKARLMVMVMVMVRVMVRGTGMVSVMGRGMVNVKVSVMGRGMVRVIMPAMSKTTKIEWCDSTFNPWLGCTKLSPGCAHCYAETLLRRFRGVKWGRQPVRAKDWSGPLKWNAKQLGYRDRRVHRVFCGSLMDWLDEMAPSEWLADLLEVIRATPNLAWLLLTKRTEACTHIGLTMDGNMKVEELEANGIRFFKATQAIGSIFGSEVNGECTGIGRTKEDAIQRLHDDVNKLHESLWA